MTAVAIDRAALESSLRRVSETLRTQPDRVYTKLRPTMNAWGADWQGRIQKRLDVGPPKSRTGRLAGSMKHKLSGSDLRSLTLRLESVGNLAYARMQEYGGEIRPKNKKWLTIPTDANKKPSGALRFTAGQLKAENPKDTFFIPYRNASGEALLLMWRKATPAVRKSAGAKKGDAVPMFRLVKKVDLPGPKSPTKRGPSRLGFFDSWNEGKAARAASLIRLGRSL